MSEPGLNNRLRQHARRSGLMVGLSMAVVIALCVGGFTLLYTRLDPFTRDFVDAANVTPTPRPQPTEPPGDDEAVAPEAEGDEVALEADEPVEAAEPTPTPTPDGFQPTHEIVSGIAINLRPGPAASSGEPLAVLSPGTQLQYLDESSESEDPVNDGLRWLRFRTEDGLEGWIREIDVQAITG